MNLVDGIPVWGSPVDEGALRQIKNCAKSAHAVALMGDHHLGYSVPIGGWWRTRTRLARLGWVLISAVATRRC